MHFVPGALRRRACKLGAILEFGLIVTKSRRRSSSTRWSTTERTLSLGYVTARIMESVFAAIGIISIISVLSVVDALSHPGGRVALVAQGNSLVHSYDWAFIWGRDSSPGSVTA